jgi:signal-transduction protein with cAMP-binding, CBS, and nucleotidyltransferase domain
MENWELAELQSLLNKQPKCRKIEELKKIQGYLRELVFFKELRKDVTGEEMVECCRFLRCQRFFSGEVVWEMGNVSDKVFVVLTGKVLYKNAENSVLRSYNEGQIFGEELLLTIGKCVTAVADINSTLLGYYLKEDYMRILNKHREEKKMALVNFLQAQKVFAKWPKWAVIELCFYLAEKTFEKGKVLFNKDDSAKYVYIIVDGEAVSISKDVKRLSSGEVIGLDEMKLSNIYNFMCVISRKSTLLLLSRYDFLSSKHLWEVQTVPYIQLGDLFSGKRKKSLNYFSFRRENRLFQSRMAAERPSKLKVNESTHTIESSANFVVKVKRKQAMSTSFLGNNRNSMENMVNLSMNSFKSDKKRIRVQSATRYKNPSRRF